MLQTNLLCCRVLQYTHQALCGRWRYILTLKHVHAVQAYGAGNFMALGLVLQQALIISTLVFLAILALWSQAGPILLFAGEYPLHAPLKASDNIHMRWRSILLGHHNAEHGLEYACERPGASGLMACSRGEYLRMIHVRSAGQEPEIVKGAVMYLQLSAPALWFYVMAECLKRYLLAQVRPPLYVMPDRTSRPKIFVTGTQQRLSSHHK